MTNPGRRGFEGSHSRPNKDEAFDVVRAIVADKADVPPDELTPQTRLQDDLEIDSLKSIEIVVALCSRCDVTIDEDEIVGVDTLARLVELIQDKL